MRELSINDTAAAIVALINSAPNTPSALEIANLIARTGPAEASPPPSRLTLELRVRRQALHSAIAEALSSERTPAYETACAEARRRFQEFDDLAGEVWRRPVASWDDVVMLAEVALAYHQDAVGHAIDGLDASCPFERSLAELLAAVATIGGCRPAPDPGT